MANAILGRGDMGTGQGCVHWDPAEPGLSSPSASGTAARRVLGCSGGTSSLPHHCLLRHPCATARENAGDGLPVYFFFVVDSLSGSPEGFLGYRQPPQGLEQVGKLLLSFGNESKARFWEEMGREVLRSVTMT